MSFSFSLTQLIGLGHPVMCGAYTATIPASSQLSMYWLLAGVYYAEGRCQREGERGRGSGGGDAMEGREVKDGEEAWWRKYPDSSLICSTITPSELHCRKYCGAAPICTGRQGLSVLESSAFYNCRSCLQPQRFKKKKKRKLIITDISPEFKMTKKKNWKFWILVPVFILLSSPNTEMCVCHVCHF